MLTFLRWMNSPAMHGLRHDVRLSHDGLYIIVELEGTIDHENARHFTDEMAHMVIETGIHRVLVDARQARNGATIRDNLLFARPREMAADPVLKKILRVILVDEADRSHDLVVKALRLKGHNVVISRDETHAIGILTGE